MIQDRGQMRSWICATLLPSICLAPSSAPAHGFGQSFELALPMHVFLAAGAGTVVLSFALVGLFVRSHGPIVEPPKLDLMTLRWLAWLAKSPLLIGLKGLSVAALGLIIAAGFFGSPDPNRNIVPTAIWVVFWVAIPYISALVVNIWSLINPWAVLFYAFTPASARLASGAWPGRLAGDPSGRGVWPAVALLFVFSWFELASSLGERPMVLAIAVLVYSLVTWAGMYLYGVESWCRRGEAFSVFFGLFACFAPMAVERQNTAMEPAPESHQRSSPKYRWTLRPPAVGLLELRVTHPSMMVFVLLALATVTFDGFSDTLAWKRVVNTIVTWDAARPFFDALWALGVYDIVAMNSAGLIGATLLFIVLYLCCCRTMAWTLGRGGPESAEERTGAIALRFVASLVPIAIGYHVAHYLSLLLVSGQLLLPLISDPLGLGWDLFGTAAHQIDFGLVDPWTLWIVSVAAILLGHLLAVYLAHVTALQNGVDRRRAVRGQLPMLVLMVGYTLTSLWIIAQPALG